MNFSQITKLAEETRDETYGILCGHDRWGYEVAGFYGDIVSTAKEEVESPYRKGKRQRAENISRYRVQMMAHGEIDYTKAAHTNPVAQHRAEMAFVAMAVKNGLCESIDEDDLLDQ